MVFAPKSCFSANLTTALAQATSTEEVNSGLESNSRENSIFCRFSAPVTAV